MAQLTFALNTRKAGVYRIYLLLNFSNTGFITQRTGKRQLTVKPRQLARKLYLQILEGWLCNRCIKCNIHCIGSRQSCPLCTDFKGAPHLCKFIINLFCLAQKLLIQNAARFISLAHQLIKALGTVFECQNQPGPFPVKRFKAQQKPLLFRAGVFNQVCIFAQNLTLGFHLAAGIAKLNTICFQDLIKNA
ncbi:hypothetical protein PsWM33_04297 [Pseudovibrio sp. WM33]|nr:hypothetical protein PsWM33_04297 [Pseudovibrio sp. WM33]